MHPNVLVFVVLPRWMALVSVLFAVVMALSIFSTFRRHLPGRGGAVMRLIARIGLGTGLFAALTFAYHINRGDPVQTSSPEFEAWGTVLPASPAPAATPQSKP